MLRNKIIFVFLSVIVANACAVATKNTKITQKKPVPAPQPSPISIPEEEPDHQTVEESKANKTDKNIEQQETSLKEMTPIPPFKPTKHEAVPFTKKIDNTEPQCTIPITINSRVLSFIKAFTSIRRESILRALNRSVEYIAEFKRIFREKGLPEELAYLPIIESGYRVDALSRARARGIWQFMASTARLFALRVDWVVDERKDPFKAADAAAKFLKQLHEKYDDWYLALAAYNGGSRRLDRAIRRLKTKDFFKIAKYRWYIRRETRNYVPAFLAALLIAKIPEKYGFTIQPDEKIFENTKTIQTPSPVSLKDMAFLIGVPTSILQKINPELLHEFTPFDKEYYSIRLPMDADESLLSQLKRLPPEKILFVGWYRVRRGDCLYSIARKFKTSVKKIKKTNKLRSNLIRPGKRLLIPRN